MSVSSFYRGCSDDLLSHFKKLLRARQIPYASLWRANVPGTRTSLRLADAPLQRAIADQLLVFDFAYLWLAEVAFLGIADILHDSTAATEQDRAKTMIAWRRSGDLAAIRQLIVVGLDVQAKGLLRVASENIDAFALSSIDAAFCAEFIAKQDVDVAHEVWFRKIAKGRARRVVEAHISTKLGMDATDGGYRDAEEKILSAAAHPSFVTGLFSALPHFGYRGKVDDGDQNTSISPHSVRTLSYCNYRLLRHMIYDRLVFKWSDQLADRSKLFTPPVHAGGVRLAVGGREIALVLAKYFEDFSERYDLGWESEPETEGLEPA